MYFGVKICTSFGALDLQWPVQTIWIEIWPLIIWGLIFDPHSLILRFHFGRKLVNYPVLATFTNCAEAFDGNYKLRNGAMCSGSQESIVSP